MKELSIWLTVVMVKHHDLAMRIGTFRIDFVILSLREEDDGLGSWLGVLQVWKKILMMDEEDGGSEIGWQGDSREGRRWSAVVFWVVRCEKDEPAMGDHVKDIQNERKCKYGDLVVVGGVTILPRFLLNRECTLFISSFYVLGEQPVRIAKSNGNWEGVKGKCNGVDPFCRRSSSLDDTIIHITLNFTKSDGRSRFCGRRVHGVVVISGSEKAAGRLFKKKGHFWEALSFEGNVVWLEDPSSSSCSAMLVLKECIVLSDQASFPPIICFQFDFPPKIDRELQICGFSFLHRLVFLKGYYFVEIEPWRYTSADEMLYRFAWFSPLCFFGTIGVMMKHFDLVFTWQKKQKKKVNALLGSKDILYRSVIEQLYIVPEGIIAVLPSKLLGFRRHYSIILSLIQNRRQKESAHSEGHWGTRMT
ncbi:hypothetical protein V8G54_009237 [Vigna mungo]|uniref:Uncharacterized protein n=1 Tax=Vigna mungo TaxID=3915 RepID=A0AAQ3NVR3_VIGMU